MKQVGSWMIRGECLQTVGKYIEYLYIKLIQKMQEKTVMGGVKLKYLFQRQNNSNTLICVFSSCTRKGIKARYNYVRTLKNVKENKLYILDDFANDHRGAYYLGKNCSNEIEAASIHLIREKIDLCHCEKLIFVGSSKGGWAALNFMCEFDNSISIVGAPQYFLGNYLMSPALQSCRDYIMPEAREEDIEFLNSYLYNKLSGGCHGNHRVYLHYSDSEHTYNDHVKQLMKDLNKLKYHTEVECLHYTEHNEVSWYFPGFLLRKINEIIGEKHGK